MRDEIESLNHEVEGLLDGDRPTEAEPLARAALAQAQQRYGDEHVITASCLHNLAEILRRQGRYAEAAMPWAMALAIRIKLLGDEHPDSEASCDSWTPLYNQLAATGDVRSVWKQVMEIHEQMLGPEHLVVAVDLFMLALTYVNELNPEETDLEQVAQAVPLLERAVAVADKTFGPEHPDTIVCRDALGTAYRALFRYAEAEPLLREHLKMLEQEHGPDHPDTVTSLDGIADLCHMQGRYAEAESLWQRVLKIREQTLGSDHPDVLKSLHDLATLCRDEARYGEAELLLKQLLEIQEKKTGQDSRETASALNRLGQVYDQQGRYAKAEDCYRRELEIIRKERGVNHRDTAHCLGNIAILYGIQGRYTEAEALYRQALEIDESAPGAVHVATAKLLDHFATLLSERGRLAEAETHCRRALEIRERVFGSEHRDTATSFNHLALIFKDQGRYTDAEPLLRQAVEISQKILGPSHPNVATMIGNLAALYHDQGLHKEAEVHYRQALAITEKALGADHPHTATSLNNLANIYRDLGRYAEAEDLLKRALATYQKTFGPDHPLIALMLGNLASVYSDQGLYEQVEPLYRRALEIREKLLGLEHPDTASSLNGLALFYKTLGRHEEAEPLYRQALKFRERHLGPEHPDTALSLNNLAQLYRAQNRIAGVEPLMRRALAIWEKALGANHPQIATALNNLGGFYTDHSRFAEAEPLLKQALHITETNYGPDHPETAQRLNNLAALYGARGKWEQAWDLSNQAVTIRIGRVSNTNLDQPSKSSGDQFGLKAPDFLIALQVAQGLASEQPHRQQEIAADSYRIAQWHTSTKAATALAQMASRFARGQGDLAVLVRRYQDLVVQLDAIDNNLVAAASRMPSERSPEIEARWREEHVQKTQQLADITARIGTTFPEYASLAHPEPLSSTETSVLLRPDEALVQILTGPHESWAWVVTAEGMCWRALPVGEPDLTFAVDTLRSGLDPSHMLHNHKLERHASSPTGRYRAFLAMEQDEEDLYYDLDLAHHLYQDLFEPFRDMIGDKRRLLLILNGPLASLPFQVLVTRAPNLLLSGPARYQQAAWMIREHELTILPSVASLKALRRIAAHSRGDLPYVGFANPIRAQPPLPETADEVCRVRSSLDGGAIFLGEQATKAQVKKMSRMGELRRFRVVHFATHGLRASETAKISRLGAEPALVLTRPADHSEEHDGLLTASEVAQLDLDADFVVLSACNTASDAGEALSGLARAFLYAGSRSLLVSHWYVVSQAAVDIVTAVFESKGDRPEAFRQAMLALIDAGDYRAHPLYWAPFVLVGTGDTA